MFSRETCALRKKGERSRIEKKTHTKKIWQNISITGSETSHRPGSHHPRSHPLFKENLAGSSTFPIFNFHVWRMSLRISSLSTVQLPSFENISHNSGGFKSWSPFVNSRSVARNSFFDTWPEHENVSTKRDEQALQACGCQNDEVMLATWSLSCWEPRPAVDVSCAFCQICSRTCRRDIWWHGHVGSPI